VAILSYLLTGEESDLAQRTTTQARLGQLQVAVKRDGDENPTQVYSELVANRLAQFLGLPVAMGVAARDGVDPSISRFASLWVADHDARVFDFTEAEPDPDAPPAPDGAFNESGFYWEFKRLCERHPIEAAQLAVFDLWIGNEDRDLNIKGQLDEGKDNEPNILFALDQGNSLLSCGLNVKDSLAKLGSPDFPTLHPMKDLLGGFECGQMVERINAMPDWALISAIVCGVQVGSVTPDVQYQLYDILDERRKLLSELVQRILLTPP
tara:strand:- start:13486 stop:14283 length:798 start_codon:yes stop_codon:yes gene_type:complete